MAGIDIGGMSGLLQEVFSTHERECWIFASPTVKANRVEVRCFASLRARGMKGVKYVVRDPHSGIRSAIKRHFQGAQWQRCRVHFKREMGRRVSYKKLKELNADLAGMFAPA